MIGGKVKITGFQKVAKAMEDIAQKMVAEAKRAVVRTAFQTRKDLDERMRKEVIVRAKGHVQVEIEKVGESRILARVGSTRPFMKSLIEGSERTSVPGKELGVPTVGPGLPRPSPETRVQREDRLNRLLNRESPRIKHARGDNQRIIKIPTPTGGYILKRNWAQPPQTRDELMYTMKERQKVEEKEWWDEQIRVAARAHLQRMKEAAEKGLSG